MLVGEQVLLRLPTPKDAAAIAAYMVRNRAFHKPIDPIRPDEHFTEQFWRKAARNGLMTEALRLAIDYMFKERNLHRIMANYMQSNSRSGRILEKLGFAIDGRAKEYLQINGRWEDHVMTSLVNKEWQEKK